MLNQVILVGRLVKEVEIEKDGEKNIAKITIACPRSYKNADGVYETDFIDCILWNAIAENSAEYCKKGDVLGIKGRLQTRQEEDKKITEVIAEKVTFLSSKRNEEE